ncbi:MAG: carboxypeptidase regulatory-like domain-containing protein, partial [Longimicrobiales bacterium]
AHSTITDSRGAFRIAGLTPGRYVLRMTHIAYGEHNLEIRVESGGRTSVRVAVSQTAIVLAPITAEAISMEELRRRGAGFGRGIVTREEIAQAEGRTMNMADVLRLNVPSVRVRRMDRVVGTPICIELRSIRVLENRCLSPVVYLDGVPISDPTSLYGALDVRIIERIEVIPAAEAGVRFGTGSLYGALLIETRKPGTVSDSAARRPSAGQRVNFDWSAEARPHRTGRVFVSALLGNAAGAALGFAAADRCLSLRQPANDRLVSECETLPSIGSGVAALVLPGLVGGLASGLAGRTQLSRGRFAPATMGAVMATLPGYALVLSGQRGESDALQWVGYSLIVVGAPVASTAADYLFRKRRGEPDEPRR